MHRNLFRLGLLGLCSTTLGCAMCCSPDDYNYAAYGGRWERFDMSQGRVGSVFSQTGAATAAMEEVEEATPMLPAEHEAGGGLARFIR